MAQRLRTPPISRPSTMPRALPSDSLYHAPPVALANRNSVPAVVAPGTKTSLTFLELTLPAPHSGEIWGRTSLCAMPVAFAGRSMELSAMSARFVICFPLLENYVLVRIFNPVLIFNPTFLIVCLILQYVPCKQERESKLCKRCTAPLPPAPKRMRAASPQTVPKKVSAPSIAALWHLGPPLLFAFFLTLFLILFFNRYTAASFFPRSVPYFFLWPKECVVLVMKTTHYLCDAHTKQNPPKKNIPLSLFH